MHFKKGIVMIIYSVIDIMIVLKKVNNIIVVCYNVKLFNQNRIAKFLISHFCATFYNAMYLHVLTSLYDNKILEILIYLQGLITIMIIIMILYCVSIVKEILL